MQRHEKRCFIDFTEEAIPERDPAYRTQDGTGHDAQTVDLMPMEMRLALAHCLEQLGMNATRAALVAEM